MFFFSALFADAHSHSGSSHINIQLCKFVLVHLHASLCIRLGEGTLCVCVCVCGGWVEAGWRGGYFQGICSNYMTKRWRVSPGAEQRLTGQGTEHSGPGNL